MRIQKTFTDYSNYRDTEALEWLLNLSKCFYIKSVKMRSYIKETTYCKRYCTKIEVTYD